MKIERAVPEDHTLLTVITKKSKAFWGYDEQQMEKWNDLLTITSDYILKNETYKLVLENEIIGYYSLLEIDPQTLKIDNLFISPKFIGKGLGKKLMADIFEKAKLNSYTSVILDSDPNAEGFYSHHGFIKIDQIKTSVKNRFLPVMKKTL